MQIHANLPVSITVTFYHPGIPAQTSGPPDSWDPGSGVEIEFEVRTLTGHALLESDFGEELWDELTSHVLLAYEAKIEESRTDARIEAEIARREWYYE